MKTGQIDIREANGPIGTLPARLCHLKIGKGLKAIIGVVLGSHLALLAWGAYVHSPTFDEVAHLPAGISHWQLGRFDLYRVNPPLVKMVAALPVLLANPITDWNQFDSNPNARPEIGIGYGFITANGPRSFWLYTLARWACIPFSLLGGYICFRWAMDLYGNMAGILALGLWCFCPNVLGNGQLITADMGGAALTICACYAFWHWLKRSNWPLTLIAGFFLGLAQLAKMTSILLFVLWPLIWLVWRLSEGSLVGRKAWLGQGALLCTTLIVALGVLNAGYGFEGSFQKLGSFGFVSKTLGGPAEGWPDRSGMRGGNRFLHSWLADIPVPVPSNYLRGMDVQKSDFEAMGRRPSYLRGEFRNGGWWYYYLYALGVKVPLGTWAILFFAILLPIWVKGISAGWRNEMVLLLPILAILIVVSTQTGFTHHLRYVLGIFPFAFVWMSRVVSAGAIRHPRVVFSVALALLCSTTSSLRIYPHSLSYFNELAGGSSSGPAHLLDSNVDWGQDLFFLKGWLDDHPEARPLRLAYFGNLDPGIVDKDFTRPACGIAIQERGPSIQHDSPNVGPEPGWYAISVNVLYGYRTGNLQGCSDSDYKYFRSLRPAAMAGFSIYIYQITPERAGRARKQSGLGE